GRAQTHARQGKARASSIDKPPAGNHEQGVNNQECRVDDAHPFRRNAELRHDAFVARARDARPVEVADETKPHQEGQDQPAASRRFHRSAPDSATRYRFTKSSLSVSPRPGPSGTTMKPSGPA